jgi:hypothetical protein
VESQFVALDGAVEVAIKVQEFTRSYSQASSRRLTHGEVVGRISPQVTTATRVATVVGRFSA